MIYFVQDSLTFRIKIGFTGKEDVKERLKELQTASSSLLYLLASREGGKEIESELHREFRRFRTQGEWFNPGPELIQYIVACSAIAMGKDAISRAAKYLLTLSFPETKLESERRVQQENKERHEKYIRDAAEDRRKIDEAKNAPPVGPDRYKPGVRVNHPTFGLGEIVDEFGEGLGRKFRISFESGGGEKVFHAATVVWEVVDAPIN